MNNDANDNLIIYWNKDSFLSWSDFKGTPDPKIPFSASSQVGFQCDYDYKTIESKSRIKLKIAHLQLKVTFRPMLSWVNPERVSELGSSILLKHEQGHFDLAEEFVRKINPLLDAKYRNKSFTIKKGTEEAVKKRMLEIEKEIATESLKELDVYHTRYDQETKRGRIDEKQQEYNQRFDNLRKRS